MSNPQTFTAKDIERYHRGQMTPAEMHELEKAALDDSFLADALEGYVHTQTPAADLQALQSRLQQRLEEKERKVVPLFGQQWVRIAALFVLLAGAGWLVFQTFNSSENSLATTETTANDITAANDSAIALPQALPPALATDSLSTLQDMAAATKAEQGLAEKETPQTMLDKNATTGRPAREDNTTTQSEAVAAAPLAEKTFRTTAPAVSAGRMQDSNQRENVVAMQNSTADSEGKTSRVQSRAKMVAQEPVEGWKAFAAYLEKARRSYSALKIDAAVRGNVELTFDTDANGQPINITVAKSLCPACDEEAIRLLKEGPRWTARNSNGNVAIPFP